MAFGKKGKTDQQAAAAAPDPAPVAESDELSSAMFAEDAPPAEEPADAAGLTAEEAEAPADAVGSDLLNMFQTTQIEQEDLSVVLDLAGDVDLDDLLEDLHTVATALGCVLDDREFAAA